MMTIYNAFPAYPAHCITLNTGQCMPLINFGGTFRPGHDSNFSEFLRQGGRGIDTALTYTDPQNALIADAISTAGIPRSELWVTTKVPCCPSGSRWCSMSEFNVSTVDAMKKNNKLLRIETTDLTLLHWPCSTAEQTIQTWLQLERGLKEGLTKAIGVSNFNSSLLAHLAADPRTSVTPAVNQCNHAVGNHNASHLPEHGGDDGTVDYCAKHGISYSAYSPLEGLSGRDIFDLPQVKAIATAHDVSGAQVALKWLVQQQPPISVVSAADKAEYIAEDLDLFSFELSQEEMAELAAI